MMTGDKKKRRRALLIGLLAAAAAGAGGYAAWKRRSGRAAEPSRTVTVEEGPIQATVEASGAVTPLNRIEIKPPIQGRVDSLLAQEGDEVRAGQVLASMSSSDRAAILDAARAKGPEELARWEDAYKPTPIVAPISGVVILRNVVQGQTVDAGTVLYAVSDRLIVTAQVDESDIGKVKDGMRARIVLDAYPERPVEGTVFDMLYEGKNVSNVITYGVKIRLARVPDFFRSQMTASVSFVTGRKARALLLPLAAVRESPSGGKRVLVPGPEGKPEPREIETGMESGDVVEVVSGLSKGESVVLAAGRYSPQKAPQSSPFALGGRGGGRGMGGARQRR